MRVLLLGAIGVGKSTVARILQTLGVPVLHTDLLAQELMQTNNQIRQQLVQAFGAELYSSTASGWQLNRDYLRAKLFATPEALNILAKILYPHTLAYSSAWFAGLSATYAVKESALAVSAKDSEIDRIVLVQGTSELSVARIVGRNPRWTVELITKVYAMQLRDLTAVQADFHILNDGRSPLLPQIWQLHRTLMEL